MAIAAHASVNRSCSEDIHNCNITLVDVGPQLDAVIHIDELHGDAQNISRLLDAAVEKMQPALWCEAARAATDK